MAVVGFLGFINGCKNEFKDTNEKSWSLSRKRVSHKIDFKAVWPRDDHAASVGVKKDQTFSDGTSSTKWIAFRVSSINN